MKFYSYTNKNRNYTMAISLENIRSVYLCNGSGKSEIRFSVRADYLDGKSEHLLYLYEDEAKKVFTEIVEILNEKTLDNQPQL